MRTTTMKQRKLVKNALFRIRFYAYLKFVLAHAVRERGRLQFLALMMAGNCQLFVAYEWRKR